MKNLLALLFSSILFVVTVFGDELSQKSQNIAIAYQQVESITELEMQNVEILLHSYYTQRAAGETIDPTMQSEVDAIMDAIDSSSAFNRLTASSVFATYNGELTSSDLTYNRVFSTSFDPLNLCQTQGAFSGSGTNVYYDVIEFSVVQAGDIDIEVVEADIDDIFGNDSYLSLYCHFDPLSPRENLIDTNDDWEYSFLSRLKDLTLPIGTYYLVVSTWGNGGTGTYEVEFRSDNGNVVLGGVPVPVSMWWIGGLFLLLVIGLVAKRFVF